MPKSPITISVVIPNYNHSCVIQKAIQSVYAQTESPMEIIVIDDGSDVPLELPCEQFPNLRVIKQSHKGVSATRNRGIKEAKGNWIAFLDADDTWPPEHLFELANLTDGYQVILGKTKVPDRAPYWLPVFSASLIHKDVFKKNGLVDETLEYSEDQDWFLRLKESDIPFFVTEKIVHKISFRSSTKQKNWKELQIHKVLKNSISRRKKRHLKPFSDYVLVSVVIPVFNGEKYLKETLESVFSQSYPSIEVIAINQGQDDRSLEILKTFPQVNVIEQKALGNGHARNTGIRKAKGEFIAFIDQDDLWKKEKLSKHMEFLIKNPDAFVSISHFLSFLSKDASMPTWIRKESFETPKPDYSPSSLVVRKSIFSKIGFFAENLKVTSDMDWFFNLQDLGIKTNVLKEMLHYRRVHESNQSNDQTSYNKELISVIRSSVQRKKRKV